MDRSPGDGASTLVALLARDSDTLAVAESCTGGLLGAAITGVPGSSEVFWGGVISYDDAAKRELLGVEATALERHGAVSEAVAVQMARGVRQRAGTTWAISVTGIAGPGGGTDEKPVGTVWIGIDGPATRVDRFAFGGDRAAVREATVEAAIGLLVSCVSGTREARPNGNGR